MTANIVNEHKIFTTSKNSYHTHAVENQASTLVASDYKDLQIVCDSTNNYYLRRITPLECERLQGMPDNWSKYGVNEKGEVFELSDNARYKLQGNGIATPFWKWMLKRISDQYEETPTLGSLFSGQGSFELIWEQLNGVGSALWNSEIEKSAVAVSRKHFGDEEIGVEGDVRQFL